MNILHIITSLRTGGAEHLMVDLLPRLRELGNEVELLVFDGRRTPFYEQLEAKGIIIHALGEGGNVYHPRNLWRLTQFLRVHRYDIVHTHNTACQLYAPMARTLSRSTFRLFTTRPMRIGVRVSPADRRTVPSRMDEVRKSMGR